MPLLLKNFALSSYNCEAANTCASGLFLNCSLDKLE
nr:MAG TPA: hypothetical protein [Bacteriophage sp.]